jgi:hypothetical protein
LGNRKSLRKTNVHSNKAKKSYLEFFILDISLIQHDLNQLQSYYSLFTILKLWNQNFILFSKIYLLYILTLIYKINKFKNFWISFNKKIWFEDLFSTRIIFKGLISHFIKKFSFILKMLIWKKSFALKLFIFNSAGFLDSISQIFILDPSVFYIQSIRK